MIQLHDKIFEPYLSKEEIQKSIAEIASKMNVLKNDKPHFIVVLNGSFLFAADLLKQLKFDAEVSFIKLKSYEGTSSTGAVNELIGLQANISNKTVIVLEDIVDTGITLEKIYSILESKNPKEILIATLLFKPTNYIKELDIHYIGLEIPNEFVVGYGLDYEELGRTLPQIYKLKSNRMLNLVLFGPPGAGKGTQSALLIDTYNLIHLSTGDILRKEIATGTALGLEAKSLMDKGDLVPDSIVIGMIKSKLEKNPCAKGYIFDGFPRTSAQAEALDSLLAELNTEISGMVSLHVDDEELTKRLLLRGKDSGRADDQDESIIRNRIKEYNDKTLPLKKFYGAQNKLQEIEGIGSIEEINRKLCIAIDNL